MVSQVTPQDEIRAVARTLSDYNLDELNPLALRLNDAATRIDRAAQDVTKAYETGVAAGRESMKSEIAAKEPIRSPASRIVRVGGLRKRV